MDISTLFANPVLKNAALGTLKKTMIDHNIHAVVITLKDGEINAEFINEPIEAIPVQDAEKYKQAYIKFLSHDY